MPVNSSMQSGLRRALERREEPRFDGGLDGSFSLSGGRADGGVRVFACRVTSLSANGMVVTAPVQAQEGENVLVDLPGFGLLRSQVTQVRPDGFVASVLIGHDQRGRLSTWIQWLRRRAGRMDGDKRGFMRIRPRDPRTTVTLADGSVLPGLLMDLSRSGAAISVDLEPVVGMELVVGQVPARVVRQLEVGFAVEFARVLEAAEADTMVSGFEPAPETTALAG